MSFTQTSVVVSPGVKGEQTFHFDSVYDGAASQEQIYADLGAPILRKALEGFNGTIFAYGQTGSGKTFTMSGGESGGPLGIVPQLGDELFFLVDKAIEEQPETKFLLTVSFLEIYNEMCVDLLAPPPASAAASSAPFKGVPPPARETLEIKEHPQLGVHVKGLTEAPVRARADLMKLLAEGGKRRATGETQMNARSSRSHAIMTLHIRQQRLVPPAEGGGGEARKLELSAKVNLVDLAGSERAAKTGAEGKRLKEGIQINQSLSALGQVILALAEQAKARGRPSARAFVPYRNSKLTRVLQESLGGNSVTVMIACVSAATAHLDESLSTLQYADRAKAIQLKAVKNEHVSEVGRLRNEVSELRRKLSERMGASEQSDADREALAAYRSQIELYEQKLQNSFEEREAACTALLERERALREQMASHHEQRRAQLGAHVHEHGGWMELLWRANPAWRHHGRVTDELMAMEAEMRAAEERWTTVGRYTALVLDTLKEAATQLTSTSSGSGFAAAELRAELASSVDLSATIDLGSVEGARALGSLGTHEASTLHAARQLVLRLCSLRQQVERGSGCRRACAALHGKLQRRLVALHAQLEAPQAPSPAGVTPAGGACTDAAADDGSVREACEDLKAIAAAAARRLHQLRTTAGCERSVAEGLREVTRALSAALRVESEQLAESPSHDESERRRGQRLARRSEAVALAAELDDELKLALFADEGDGLEGEAWGGRPAGAAIEGDSWKAATSSASLAPYLMPDTPPAAAPASPSARPPDATQCSGGVREMLSLSGDRLPAVASAGDEAARAQPDGAEGAIEVGNAELALLERLLGGLKVLERCAGHRMLHREQSRGKPADGAAVLDAAAAPLVVIGRPQAPAQAITANAPPSPSKASNVALLCQVAELKEELELVKKSNAQLLTVVSCQAASIEQITSGKGDAGAREGQQQAALAEQAARLAEVNEQLVAMKEQTRRQHEALAQELVRRGEGGLAAGMADGSGQAGGDHGASRRGDPSVPGGAARGGGGVAEADAAMAASVAGASPTSVTADTVARELRLQLKQQAQLSETRAQEHAAEVARLSERAAKAESRVAATEKEVAVSREVRETMQAHIDEQAAELKASRAVEENFATLAAKLGCIDEEGQLMRSRLEQLTMELVEARASEQQYQEWLADVKMMMASGKEDGLAMALAQNMMESRKKDELIQAHERELKRLRLLSRDGRKAELLPAASAPPKENKPAVGPGIGASTTTSVPVGGLPARPPAGPALHAVARPRMPGRAGAPRTVPR